MTSHNKMYHHLVIFTAGMGRLSPLRYLFTLKRTTTKLVRSYLKATYITTASRLLVKYSAIGFVSIVQ